jgi:hypothetical protein
VAQATPPPDPRRTDREAVARRRAEQVNAALARARTSLAAGDLEKALEECEHAFIFDEDHADALALEEEIRAVRGASSGKAPTSGLPGGPAAPPVEPIPPAPLAIPQVPATDREQVDARSGDTVLAPVRRTPAPARIAKPRQRQVQEAWTVLRTRATDLFSNVSAGGRKVVAQVVAWPRPLKVKVGVGVAILLVAAAAATVIRPAAVPMYTLVIDATPWASIDAIASDSGEPQPLLPGATTPFAIALPEGSYSITLTGPPPARQSQRVNVTVAAGGPTLMPTVRFGGMTTDEYFEEYLASAPAAGGPSDVPPSDSATTPPSPRVTP